MRVESKGMSIKNSLVDFKLKQIDEMDEREKEEYEMAK